MSSAGNIINNDTELEENIGVDDVEESGSPPESPLVGLDSDSD